MIGMRTPLRRRLKLAALLAVCAAVAATPALTQAMNEKLRQRVWRTDPCLAWIVDAEQSGWDPTVDFGGGHGNVYESYGLPQALPGTKMASAGRDWRTNPLTQLRWMRWYVNGRYGGSCAAKAFWQRNGWY